ncbi:MAG: glycosyltransferase family 2 protein [Roseburia sp.]|nr:glycosyltransferase family 2 protein [Roseburia sp.]
MRITIFTPTYNRGYILPVLYHSLQQQTFKNFEWIVIDDGSTDNTEELLEDWKNKEKDFPIIYKKTENGGKCRAINRGVELAESKAFFIVDSDDYLLSDAIEKVCEWFGSIEDDERFAGVSGLRGLSQEIPIGGWPKFDSPYVDCSYFDRGKYGLLRDKAEIYKTSILKQYTFPEYEGEKYITPSIIWDAIAGDGYMLRYFKDIIYVCDYLEDGLTRNGYGKFVKCPKGTMAYINLLEKIHGKEVADKKKFRFFFILCTLYGVKKAVSIMELDDFMAHELENWYSEMLDGMRGFFEKKGIRNVAIYGLGNVGMAFLDVAKLTSVKVMYGFDQKAVPVKTIPVYSVINNYGDVDAVIITMRVYDDGVKRELMDKFSMVFYWKDISSKYWFDE